MIHEGDHPLRNPRGRQPVGAMQRRHTGNPLSLSSEPIRRIQGSGTCSDAVHALGAPKPKGPEAPNPPARVRTYVRTTYAYGLKEGSIGILARSSYEVAGVT